MGSRKLGAQQVEAGSQGPTARLATAFLQGILNQQDALVPSSPSLRRTTSSMPSAPPDQPSTASKWRAIVLGTPGMRRTSSSSTLQGKAGENGQPGCCLCKSSLQETVGYAGGKLPAGVANDWVTRRSPVACLADLKVNTPDACSSFSPPRGDLPSEGGACRIACMRGGSMYSLACRTPGIIPREYCSLRDRGA